LLDRLFKLLKLFLFLLLVLDELFELPVFLQVFIESLHLTFKLRFLVFSLLLKLFQLLLSIVPFFIMLTCLLDRFLNFPFLALNLFVQILVNLINIILLLPQLIDLVPQLLIVGYSSIQLLISLLQLVLKSPYFLEQILNCLWTLWALVGILWICVKLLWFLQFLMFFIVDLCIHIHDLMIKILRPVKFCLNLCQICSFDLGENEDLYDPQESFITKVMSIC